MWYKIVITILLLVVPNTLTYATCPGDINVDLRVGTEDLMLILEHWGEGDPGGPLMPWDLNRDGRTNTQDVLILFQTWGLGSSSSPWACYPFGAPPDIPVECIISTFDSLPDCEYVWGEECEAYICQQKECQGFWCP